MKQATYNTNFPLVSFGMVSTRRVVVGGIPYIQVVDYKKTHEGKTKIDVVKSFGRDTLESRMKAGQFSASYEKLKELAIQQRDQSSSGDFASTALAIFGIILGTAIVVGVLGEIFGDE